MDYEDKENNFLIPISVRYSFYNKIQYQVDSPLKMKIYFFNKGDQKSPIDIEF